MMCFNGHDAVGDAWTALGTWGDPVYLYDQLFIHYTGSTPEEPGDRAMCASSLARSCSR